MKIHNTSRVLLYRTLAWLAVLLSVSPASGQGSVDHSAWLPLVLNKPAPANPVHTDIATYYNANGDGACMFGPSPGDLMVSAMNSPEYGNAAACGAYVHVIGPKGQVTVRIVDLCPECNAGHLDLSREAFARIANLPQGRVDITWQVVSPDLPGPVAYHFKDSSNQWWTAVRGMRSVCAGMPGGRTGIGEADWREQRARERGIDLSKVQSLLSARGRTHRFPDLPAYRRDLASPG